jgi:hypothetical protein
MSKFLSEKMAILRSRIPVWRGMLVAKFSASPTIASSTAVILGRIWRTNDAACWRYEPKPYSGILTDFRPAKQYRIFDKPELKWERLAEGGQEVIVLPVYPASMLLEPFVEHLGHALTQVMDRAIANAGDLQNNLH